MKLKPSRKEIYIQLNSLFLIWVRSKSFVFPTKNFWILQTARLYKRTQHLCTSKSFHFCGWWSKKCDVKSRFRLFLLKRRIPFWTDAQNGGRYRSCRPPQTYLARERLQLYWRWGLFTAATSIFARTAQCQVLQLSICSIKLCQNYTCVRNLKSQI